MLSAESATGAYPVETVEMMSRIIEKTERHKHYRLIVEATELEVAQSPPHAVPSATAGVAAALKAPAIVAYTASGTTASRISRARPPVPILACQLSSIGVSSACDPRTSLITRTRSSGRSRPRSMRDWRDDVSTSSSASLRPTG
ncbi:pyruvate kinase alpha/beta domain-containing protein [Mesorhizobium sp. WSM3864]|uniref:pyruvate kinase alpha/beta domain-containing protein n=1 Tax=Mesorhizobium sp. WSM3864 TaxID=2029404 RepID=UPI0032AFF421